MNGDATCQPFQQSGIEGEVIVWREILSEGPVKNIPAKDFFKLRSGYVSKNSGGQTDEYDQKVIGEYQKILDSQDAAKIYLWFEHDLVCQVNLLFLLHTLCENVVLRQKNSLSVHPEVLVVQFYSDAMSREKYRGFGPLNGHQMRECFAETIAMDHKLLQDAADYWKAYVSNVVAEIERLIPIIPPQFPFLKNALAAHLKRIPSANNGLTAPEEDLLKIIASNSFNHAEVIQCYLEADNQYGSPDIVVDQLLSGLSAVLISSSEKLMLSSDGKQILAGKMSFAPIRKSFR